MKQVEDNRAVRFLKQSLDVGFGMSRSGPGTMREAFPDSKSKTIQEDEDHDPNQCDTTSQLAGR